MILDKVSKYQGTWESGYFSMKSPSVLSTVKATICDVLKEELHTFQNPHFANFAWSRRKDIDTLVNLYDTFFV